MASVLTSRSCSISKAVVDEGRAGDDHGHIRRGAANIAADEIAIPDGGSQSAAGRGACSRSGKQNAMGRRDGIAPGNQGCGAIGEVERSGKTGRPQLRVQQVRIVIVNEFHHHIDDGGGGARIFLGARTDLEGGRHRKLRAEDFAGQRQQPLLVRRIHDSC